MSAFSLLGRKFAPTALTAGAVAASAALTNDLQSSDSNVNNVKAKCTAIAAVVGKGDYDARKFLLEGLEKIKTRGYDGAGMATMNPKAKSMVIIKRSSSDDKSDPIQSIALESKSHHSHSIGMAHTRWATHGPISDVNAHPHTDTSGSIAVVHNGAIFNARELRKELMEEGYKFDGQTDTEVIAKLIGKYHQHGKVDVRTATEKAMKKCVGTWGLCVMCADHPDELVVTSHGSPLYIGIGDEATYVASNPSAFSSHTRNFIKLDDREVATINVDGRDLDLSKSKPLALDEEEMEVKTPAPYPHWFIKEVMEQPQAIGRALCFGGRLSLDTATLGGLEDRQEELKTIDNLAIVGCGSSYNAAMYGTKLFRHSGCFANVFPMDANSTEESDFRSQADPKTSGMVVLSQSGETTDIIDVVRLAKSHLFPVMSVVNEVGSTVANMTKCGVYTNAGPENASPSTKSFTCQVVCLALMALWFRQLHSQEKNLPQHDNALAEALQRLPITFGMLMRTQSACKKKAKLLASKEHCFVLGKGYGEPIAMEGALKLKEVGYLHAEGYSGGALKHGPFAMIESDENGKCGATPIVMLVLDDNHAHHMRTACEEVKARGAELIIITDNRKLADGLDDDPIIIPSNGPLTALGAIVPLQMMAYELAMLKDNNPDHPRHLLKTFTTV